MTTTFSVTSDDIVKASLKECGALGTGEALQTEDATDARFALNIILKSWVKKGLPLWKIVQISIPTVLGNATCQIGPTAQGPGAVVTDRPLRVFDPFIRDANNVDLPLQVLSRQEYEQFGMKFMQTIPNAIYYQALKDNGLLTIYPTPIDTTRTIIVQAQVPISDIADGTTIPDVPSECYQALKWTLCAEIAGPYVSSEMKLQRIEAKAEKYFDEMVDWSREEASIYMGMDNRWGQ